MLRYIVQCPRYYSQSVFSLFFSYHIRILHVILNELLKHMNS